MKKLLTLILFLGGCNYGTNITPESSQFSSTNDIKDLEGTYINRGSGFKFLSNIIWKNNENRSSLTYAELINVTSDGDSVTVKAIKNGCVFFESKFVVGKDFKFENGKIKLRSEFSLSSKNHIGPYFQKEVIGIDEYGDGKYISKESGAGLIFMMIPMAGHSTTEYAFKRIETNKAFIWCENR